MADHETQWFRVDATTKQFYEEIKATYLPRRGLNSINEAIRLVKRLHNVLTRICHDAFVDGIAYNVNFYCSNMRKYVKAMRRFFYRHLNDLIYDFYFVPETQMQENEARMREFELIFTEANYRLTVLDEMRYDDLDYEDETFQALYAATKALH